MGVCVPVHDPPPPTLFDPLCFSPVGVQVLVRDAPTGRAREGGGRGFSNVLGKWYHKERTGGENRGIGDECCTMSVSEGGGSWGDERETVRKRARKTKVKGAKIITPMKKIEQNNLR